MGVEATVEELAGLLAVPAGDVEISPVDDLFGSPFRVTDAAVASVAVAVAAVAALNRQRTGRDATGSVDGRHAAAAFHSERVLRLQSRGDPDLWDPIAGNYPTADGWVRLHTNLPHHRAAALQVLDVAAERPVVAAEVARWKSGELEAAVVDAGGVAARMRTRAEYRDHPQRAAVMGRRVVDVQSPSGPESTGGRDLGEGEVLEGVRVLDLSRVIAGPVAGRFLTSFGADVVRVDPPLEDGDLIELETGFGKRRTNVDLTDWSQRRRLEELVAGADVLFEGFRPGVLARAGFPDERLRELSPGLVIGHLSAYGTRGPWADRRGFDSVVQVATGIAHACGFDPTTGPGRLPAQALDHATGYLLAAGLVAGLLRRVEHGVGSTVNVSLARTAEWLDDLGRQNVPERDLPRESIEDLIDVWPDTAWGPVEHLRPPGAVGDRPASWGTPATPRTDEVVAWSS